MNARHVEKFKWFGGGVDEPGDYKFTVDSDGATVGLLFICPKRRIHGVTFDVAKGAVSGPRWKWNGNRERPTITPSIASSNKSCCGLHVYMTDGQWRGAAKAGGFVDT